MCALELGEMVNDIIHYRWNKAKKEFKRRNDPFVWYVCVCVFALYVFPKHERDLINHGHNLFFFIHYLV